MTKQIKDFKLLDPENNQLFSRESSIIDWIQEGIVEVHKVKVMKKKWQKKFKKKYIGMIWGISNESPVIFADRDII